jgi:hypothetical protein
MAKPESMSHKAIDTRTEKIPSGETLGNEAVLLNLTNASMPLIESQSI